MTFNINTKQVAHIVAQVRAKQLATRDTQNKMQKIIIKYCEDHPEISEAKLAREVVENLEQYAVNSQSINSYLATQSLSDIGYPIKNNKTSQLIDVAKQWAISQEGELISQIINSNFCHRLTNNILADELPTLQSPSLIEYWGNENPTVSSVMLASLAIICQGKHDSMPGTAMLYSFCNKNYQFPEELVPASYPFASKSSMVLFGDYQFGAHSDFKDQSETFCQLLFAPEDCSSAVGKATYLIPAQVRDIATSNMINAYFDSNNEYNYSAITKLGSNEIKATQLALIQPGDIYLVKGHTAICATAPDNNSQITTLQFSRDVDIPENKILGGGIYDYNLLEQIKTTETIYILRPAERVLHEACSLGQLLHKIDEKYADIFSNDPLDTVGDCSIFWDY